MENLLVNITGKTRKETLNGKEYLVAPVTMIVPGVLNGSQGPLYYSKEVVANNVDPWNGIPLVVTHPTLNGSPVSARAPEVLETFGVGFVFNSKLVDDSLTAEAWFDIEATERVDNRILESLEDEKNIELSTGLFTDNVAAKEGATFNEKSYTHEVRNFRPDHLAILPDETGACSIQDGCGVLVNKETGLSHVVTETGHSLFTHDSVVTDNSSHNASDVITMHKSGFHKCTIHNSNDEWLTENELSHSQLHDMLSRELQSRFTQDQPHAWITEVFDDFIIFWQGDELFKLSYTKSDNSVSLSSETPQKVIRETNFVATSNEEISMAKKDLIDKLVSNCSCWTEEDKETLNKLKEDKLKKLVESLETNQENEQVANAAKKGFETDTTKFVFNAESKKWNQQTKEKKEPVTNKEESNKDSSQEPAKPVTNEEWLNSAPDGIRNAVQNAMRIEQRARKEVIEKIVANISSDEEKAKKVEALNKKSLNELEEILSFIPERQQQQTTNDGSLQSFFIGNAGAPPSTVTENVNDEEPLEVPEMEFSLSK